MNKPWYRLSGNGSYLRIEKRTPIKVLPKSLVFNDSGYEHRELKTSKYGAWFSSFRQARIRAISILKGNVSHHERMIETAKETLAKFEHDYESVTEYPAKEPW